jgi:hypothetical protein
MKNTQEGMLTETNNKIEDATHITASIVISGITVWKTGYSLWKLLPMNDALRSIEDAIHEFGKYK